MYRILMMNMNHWNSLHGSQPCCGEGLHNSNKAMSGAVEIPRKDGLVKSSSKPVSLEEEMANTPKILAVRTP